MKPTLYVAVHHGALLDLWRAQGARALRLCHVDAHCDLRGLLVDPARDRAAARGLSAPDNGNFLAVAAAEGRLESLRWVWPRWGGRARDVGTVRRLGDPSALPVRLGVSRPDWFPFRYVDMREERFSGRLEEGEHLDVDWDFFASREGPLEGLGDRVARFLALPLTPTPPAIYLAHSPPYSHPTAPRFEELVRALSARFDADVVRLPDPPRVPRVPTLTTRARWAAEGWLHRHGLF